MASGYHEYPNQSFNGFTSHSQPFGDTTSSNADHFDYKQFYEAFTNDGAHTSEHFDPHLALYSDGYPQDQSQTAYVQQSQPPHSQAAPFHHHQGPNDGSGQPINLADFQQLDGGLHIQAGSTDGLPSYAPAGTLSTNTVATLEAAAARSAAQYTQPSSGSSHASSRRSTMDGVPHIASLSLSSPRHSLSTTSSASSSQNSPTTPLSAYSIESGQYSHMQQQQYRPPYHHQSSNGFAPGYAAAASSAYGYAPTPQPGTSALLSMSMPPSLAEASRSQAYHAGYQQPPPAQYTAQKTVRGPASIPLSQSVGRLSNAGLMDQVVSARKAVVSPDPAEGAHTVKSSKTEARQRRDSRSSRSSRSRTSTPPSTPARAATLRSSRAASNASQTAEDPVSQTPSSAGPHRTPSKRMQAALDGGSASAQASAPQRPGGLRRSASEYGVVTPKTAKKYSGSSATGGLGSPADMDSVIMRQQQSEAYTSSMAALQSSKGAATPVDGPLLGGGMMRTRSSPGFAPTLARPASSSEGTGAVPRRSSTLSGLQMSPMPRSTAVPSPSQTEEISYETAALALDQIAQFLNQQSILLAKAPNQDVRLALGTFEQSQSIEDLRARIQARLSSGAFLGLA